MWRGEGGRSGPCDFWLWGPATDDLSEMEQEVDRGIGNVQSPQKVRKINGLKPYGHGGGRERWCVCMCDKPGKTTVLGPE